jgi:thiaminase
LSLCDSGCALFIGLWSCFGSCRSKGFDADDVIQFAEAAKIAIIVERSLHNDFMQHFDISKQQFESTPLTLACHHYTSFLTATAWSESYPVVLARCYLVSGFMRKWVKIS